MFGLSIFILFRRINLNLCFGIIKDISVFNFYIGEFDKIRDMEEKNLVFLVSIKVFEDIDFFVYFLGLIGYNS